MEGVDFSQKGWSKKLKSPKVKKGGGHKNL